MTAYSQSAISPLLNKFSTKQYRALNMEWKHRIYPFVNFYNRVLYFEIHNLLMSHKYKYFKKYFDAKSKSKIFLRRCFDALTVIAPSDGSVCRSACCEAWPSWAGRRSGRRGCTDRGCHTLAATGCGPDSCATCLPARPTPRPPRDGWRARETLSCRTQCCPPRW